MSDYKSGLPVRSEADGTDERVLVKIQDGTTPGGVGGTADVSDGNVHTYVHGQDPASTETLLRTSELGHVAVDGVYDGTNNTDPSNMGLVAHVRNATPGDAQQTVRVTGITNSTVHALDVAIRAADGAAFSTTNPLPVYVTGSAAGDEVMSYNTAANVAKDATSSHTYTPTSGKVLTLQKIAAASAGKMKLEVKIGPTGSEVTKLVLFNSTANPNIVYDFALPQSLTDAQSVVLVRTNLDNAATDLYSTIEGMEVTP